jgi:hypothetical protein
MVNLIVNDEPVHGRPATRRELLHPFAAYFALGDSMSMDLYPKYDARDKEGAYGHADGAATLLHHALMTVTPDAVGGVGGAGYRVFQNLTEDGAVCSDLQGQVSKINPGKFGLRKGEPVLLSITAGGNDLLRVLPISSFNAAIEEMDRGMEALSLVFDRIERVLGDYPPTILLGNVYDPTDGTGLLTIHATELDVRQQLRCLDYWNERVFEKIISEHPGLNIVPVDIYGHFYGHGAKGRLGVGSMLGDRNRCHTPSFWYWSRSWIEPGVQGAVQLAGLWWRKATKE